MKLLFRQRFFSWFDSYDIFDEAGRTLYVVKGKLGWGHVLKIYDAYGEELGMVKERIIALLPRFDLYQGETRLGCIRKALTFFRPHFDIDFNGWSVQGSFFEWDYQVLDASGSLVATVSKVLWNLTDTYTIDVEDSRNALYALMLVLAIDAEKCSRGD